MLNHAGYDVAGMLLEPGQLYCFMTNQTGPEIPVDIEPGQAATTQAMASIPLPPAYDVHAVHAASRKGGSCTWCSCLSIANKWTEARVTHEL